MVKLRDIIAYSRRYFYPQTGEFSFRPYFSRNFPKKKAKNSRPAGRLTGEGQIYVLLHLVSAYNTRRVYIIMSQSTKFNIFYTP